jgi:hypothetical protein
MSDEKPTMSTILEFPEGSLKVTGGVLRFHFRNMEYVYKEGADAPDGMAITLPEDVSESVRTFLRDFAR